MRTVAYAADDVVQVPVVLGSQVQIEFSPEEGNLKEAAADTADMMVQPYGHFLFIKPKKVVPGQPLTVISTRKDGSLRPYQFQLVTIAPEQASPTDIVYSIRFTYPADVARVRAAAWHKKQIEVQQTAAKVALQKAKPTVPLNIRYVAQGDRILAPVRLWDDGQSTYLRYPGDMRMPVPYVRNPDGKWALTDYSVHGDTMEISRTAAAFQLRDGNAVLCIANRAGNPIGIDPGTGTTSADVTLKVRTGAPL